jgi:hypothetical protein
VSFLSEQLIIIQKVKKFHVTDVNYSLPVPQKSVIGPYLASLLHSYDPRITFQVRFI